MHSFTNVILCSRPGRCIADVHTARLDKHKADIDKVKLDGTSLYYDATIGAGKLEAGI